MKISSLDVKLNGDDVLSLIDDWVHINGLTIKTILIREEIEIEGNYKAIINMPFRINVKLEGNSKDNIYLNLINIKIYKLKIVSFLKNMALNKVIQDFKEEGVEFEDGRIIIKIDKLLKKLPVYLNIKLKELYLNDNFINVKVEEINFSMNKVEEQKEELESEQIKESVEILNKTKDCYTDLKSSLKGKISEKHQQTFKYASIIPDLIALVVRLFKDKRVPTKIKIAVSLAITYVAVPTDILPDNIPVIGKMDDIAMIFFALNKILNNVDETVILENWEGEENIIEVIKEGVQYINNFSGGTRIDRIYNVF